MKRRVTAVRFVKAIGCGEDGAVSFWREGDSMGVTYFCDKFRMWSLFGCLRASARRDGRYLTVKLGDGGWMLVRNVYS